jgi:predicted ABC-type ATPase
MSDPGIKRLRMFAGPNGSGKSTLVRRFAREHSPAGLFSLQCFVNADELARALLTEGIGFDTFGLEVTWDQLRESLLAAKRLDANHPFLSSGQVQNSRLTAPADVCGDYVAACIADFLHEELLACGLSFSFETVMSHPSKIELFARARAEGYRTYLYFIATDSAVVNRGRVRERVAKGGHDVPEDKILERYERSLRLVRDALAHAYRAFIFDNSGGEPIWLAEFDPQGECKLQLPPDSLPRWFHTWIELPAPPTGE